MIMIKYIFVTGGVVSGLGKGITAASLGRLLKARGLKVAAQKLDPYINVDPGTMSPYQHGEVYVTEDGAETDLDLGHYERFIDEDLNQYSNLTAGKVYWNVLNKERRGEYLGFCGGGAVGNQAAGAGKYTKKRPNRSCCAVRTVRPLFLRRNVRHAQLVSLPAYSSSSSSTIAAEAVEIVTATAVTATIMQRRMIRARIKRTDESPMETSC